jgi:hypothetical protein
VRILNPFPKAIPSILVSEVPKAIEFYVNALSFHLYWHNEQRTIAGTSQGDCCL